MVYDYLSIVMIIAIFSVIQSVFGMGILVFGTPTLLIMGYDFSTTLSYLLPASWSISFLQIFHFESKRPDIPVSLYVFCLPFVVIGLLLSGSALLVLWLKNIIGATLIMSAVIRYWEPAQDYFTAMVSKHEAIYHATMGLVHGITNLGGALLAVFASEIHTDKYKIRYMVAYYYFAFNSIQIFVLVTLMGHIEMLITNAFTAFVSALIYVSVGNRIFNGISNRFFANVLTLFIFSYGVLILFQK